MSKRCLLILSVLLSPGILFGAPEEKNNIEVTAKRVEGTKTTLSAKEGVMVYYQDSVIRADEAHYDKTAHRLVLDGHVEMIGYQGTKEHTSHMEIDTQSNTISFKELFFTNENDIWLLSNDANRTDGNYTFSESMLSSCDIDDPLWTMQFARSTYDSEEKYMKLYDAKVYFDDIPVFYTPYLAFSTNNERASGLLFPLFGYSVNEGFVYEQPVFWAISDSMDLEFNPQIRTNRSLGIYATYRFVDSPHSSGQFRAGYFKDKASYAKEYNLPEDQHYGLEFLYDSSKVWSDDFGSGYKDGLYANITLLNDIDYLNLQKTSLTHFGQVPLQESRLNYFLHNNDWYGGLNAKYFIDTREPSNDKTLQTLPAMQFHKYLKSLLWDNLTYSVDLQTRRFDRQEGVTLNQAEFRVPFELTFAFFDDYLSMTLGETLYYGRFFFGNEDTLIHDYFQYNSNVHTAKIFSDLTKQYNGYVHVLQPSLSYIKPGTESKKPVDFETLVSQQGEVKALFSVGLPEERAVFALSQYIYDYAMRLIFFQRLSQNYYANRAYALGELGNEMQYNWENWRFYNNIYYSFEYNDIAESSTRVSVSGENYSISVGHTFKKLLDVTDQPISANDLNLNATYTYNERISMTGGGIYSIEEETARRWYLGTAYKRDCWSMALQVNTDIVPRPSNIPGQNAYTEEYGFFIQLNFIPFASIGSGKQ